MAELVYPPVIGILKTVFKAMGLRITVQGAENLPRTGGAVIASNHVSYLDFTLVGYGALPTKRLVRFMAKESVFRHWASGPLMRGMHHIPVDRAAGSQAFREALAALKAGEVIGVFPEATISQSFMLKEFKAGAARLAQATGTPIVPCIVWGGQRIYSKGTPKDFTGRGKAITIAYGEPLHPAKAQDSLEVTAELHRRMAVMLDDVQRSYPQAPSGPQDRWWLPASMGGTAPTPEEAAARESRGRVAPPVDPPA